MRQDDVILYMSGNYLLELLIQYKYAILFPAAFIEGPIITVLVGLLSVEGRINGPSAYLIAVAADLFSDTFWYVIGRYGYHLLTPKNKKWMGISDEVIGRINRGIKSNFGKIIFIGKFTQVYASIIELAAGIARIPFGTFIFYNAVNTLLKSALFFYIGVFFGHAYQNIQAYLDIYSVIVLFLGVILSAWFVQKIIRDEAKKATDSKS